MIQIELRYEREMYAFPKKGRKLLDMTDQLGKSVVMKAGGDFVYV